MGAGPGETVPHARGRPRRGLQRLSRRYSVFALYNADLAGGKLGLFVEQGRASFRDLQALVLADTPREGA